VESERAAPDGLAAAADRRGTGSWSQGLLLAYLQDICGYWADGYDWRATKARLNSLPQYRTEIHGAAVLGEHRPGEPYPVTAVEPCWKRRPDLD